MNIRKWMLLGLIFLALTFLIFHLNRSDEFENVSNETLTIESSETKDNEITKPKPLSNQTEENSASPIIESSSAKKPDELLLQVFRQDYKDFSNYITPIEEIISNYDNIENQEFMQELFEIISNDLDTAEKITDSLDQFENLSIEELRSAFDRAGFFMITSPYVYARLYSNLTPENQAAVNMNWDSEAIVEAVVLKAMYELVNGSSDEYEFKSISPNNKYYKVVMEIVDKDSELFKKQGNYVLYMYSNKVSKQAEIEYVFCVDENDRVNQSPLAGSFQLKDLLNH